MLLMRWEADTNVRECVRALYCLFNAFNGSLYTKTL